jgi:hypothetical protein
MFLVSQTLTVNLHRGAKLGCLEYAFLPGLVDPSQQRIVFPIAVSFGTDVHGIPTHQTQSTFTQGDRQDGGEYQQSKIYQNTETFIDSMPLGYYQFNALLESCPRSWFCAAVDFSRAK